MKVLVVGATGALGRPVVQQLRSRGIAVRALLEDPPPCRMLAHFLSVAALPLHPGMARVMRLMSLPVDAIPERFDGAAALEREHGITLTTLEAFVAARVAEARARAGG